MRKSKDKIHGHTWWHRHLDPKQGKWLRETFKECAWCHGPGYLVVSHVFPKGRYQGLRYDPMNILPMHGNCHQFIWHANPLESAKWFAQTFPDRLLYLNEAKKIIVKRDLDYYQKVDKALEERKTEDLFTYKTAP